ncbi:hypothetical protein ACHQM5_015767 [Ranunculus cassubicifolius]
MNDPRLMLSEDVSNPKSRKKKIVNQAAAGPPAFQTLPQALKTSKKAFKKPLKPEVSPPSDSSRDGEEYRALRRKYLLLEDENFGLGRELVEVDEEVKTLEEDKLALLDQLVVLEGLIEASEIQNHRPPAM